MTEAIRPASAAEALKPLELVAVVTSKVSKVVSTDFEARVEKVLVHNGQHVQAGDVIAQLDTAELKAKLAQATAQRQSAAGNAERAAVQASSARRKANLEQRLIRSGASAPEAFRSAMSDANAASAEGASAYGQIHEAASQIDELERLIKAANVVAPFEGVVSVVKAKEGEVAHKGAAIARVFDPHDLVVKFAVPHAQRSQLKVGQVVDLHFEGELQITATVKTITDDNDPAIDFSQVEAELDETRPHPDEIRVGVFGHVRIANKGVVR